MIVIFCTQLAHWYNEHVKQIYYNVKKILKRAHTYKATFSSIILLIQKYTSINTLCMCWDNWPILNTDFFGGVLNLLEDVMNEIACSWWKKPQIYALQWNPFLDVIHRLLLWHFGRSVQLSQIQRQILQIQMVLAIRWSAVNWQWGHPSLHPPILQMYLPIIQKVVTMFESKTFNY